MTTREYTLAVQEELKKEGFTIVGKYSQGRFGAKDYDGTKYEVHVKYCVEPRVLHTSDVGFMSCFMIEDAIRLFITNGIGLTSYAESSIRELNDAEPILNWTPGTQIIREPGSIHVEAKKSNIETKPQLNGFEIIAESYRKLSEEGKISQEEAEKKCKAYDYLASCDDEDIYNLFDSSVFNEIAKSYMRLTVKELISEGQLDEDQGRAVGNRFSLLFDEKRTKEILSSTEF